MDDSKVNRATNFNGLEIELHRFAGARVLRVVHPGEQRIEEHSHDWAYIGLYTAGRYREQYDGGEADMSGPCAVLHPAGRPHADVVEAEGLETLTIEFDPAWLRLHGFNHRLDRSLLWSGGPVGLASRRLSQVVAALSADEAALGQATAQFLNFALMAEAQSPPGWVAGLRERLGDNEPGGATEIARTLDLHPAYLARAYRAAMGEGVTETRRRRRVETASALLRHSPLPLAEIAVAAGFCDQSHMNRSFSAVLGRTPLQVRRERQLFDERLAVSA
ncbi:helix-turn-helix domain-containing protein [Sphingomonas sp. URHD0057]|uniref:helix-turn-helix domain-containing protein n=1 Tax=Sphingomonas sp. URHD0057 TaxID=1380389 RepID=UPI00048D10E1|nr:helix-turn-helix domain-containing protein [Sphingomonas sp. URHD0057]